MFLRTTFLSLMTTATWGQLNVSVVAGVLSTIAGNGQMGDLGDGGPALEAQIEPSDFGFDSKGNVYIVSSLHQRVRRVRPDGIIEPYAGISHLDRCSIVSSVCDQGSGVSCSGPTGPVRQSVFADGGS
jgi:hypothetical protein